MEKMVCYSQFPEEGVCHALGGHQGSTGVVRRQREQGRWTGDFIMVSAKRNR